MIRWYALLILLLPLSVIAQTTDFTITIFGAEDTVPPSVPVITNAVAVTSNQISLTWATSTDNNVVGGYIVYRDGSALATTSLVTYLDAAVAASTTYLYSVQAFDTSFNYSATSSPASVTTPDVPIVQPDQETTTTAFTRVSLETTGLSAVVGTSSSVFSFTTNRPARVELRYGLTPSHESGAITGQFYRQEHQVPLRGLLPGTRYHYEMIGYNNAGRQFVLDSGTFTTTELTAAIIANVSAFQAARVSPTTVRLQYELPAQLDPDAIVRVVRNQYQFPTSPTDGEVIYEGLSTTILDETIGAQVGHYTIFVMVGNLHSSGAIAYVTGDSPPVFDVIPFVPPLQNPTDSPDQGRDTATAAPTSTPVYTLPTTPSDSPLPAPIVKTIPNQWLQIHQSGEQYTFASSSIRLNASRPFTVLADPDVFESDYETIIASLENPDAEGEWFTFMLREDLDLHMFAAKIAPLNTTGTSSLVLTVYNSLNATKRVSATMVDFYLPIASVTAQYEWRWWYLYLLMPPLLILLLWIVFTRRITEDKETTK